MDVSGCINYEYTSKPLTSVSSCLYPHLYCSCFIIIIGGNNYFLKYNLVLFIEGNWLQSFTSDELSKLLLR